MKFSDFTYLLDIVFARLEFLLDFRRSIDSYERGL